MRLSRMLLFFLSLNLLAWGTAFAQTCPQLTPVSTHITYYVSQTGGSDSVACSSNRETAAFATITRALQCAVPGDTVLVKNGTYDKFVISGKNGSASAWLSVKAYPGHRPVIDGRNNVSNYRGIIEVNSSRYVLVSGFEVMHTGAFTPGGYGIRLDTSNYVVVESNKVHEIWQTGILAQNSSYVQIQGNEVFNTSMRNQNRSSTSGWSGGTSTHGGYATQCVSWFNNAIHDVWGECLDPVNVNGGTIRGNVVHDCFSVNIYLDSSKNFLVDSNYSYSTNTAYYRSNAPAAGIQIAKERTAGNPAQNLTLSNNILDGTGIRYWAGVDTTAADTYGNIVIANNFIRNTVSSAIAFDAPNGNVTMPNALANNIIYGVVRFRTDDTQNGGAQRSINWKSQNNFLPSGGGTLPSATGTVLNVNPLLVGPTVGQASSYMLRDASPCRSAGTAAYVASVPYDFAGVARSTTKPSVGVDEHATLTGK